MLMDSSPFPQLTVPQPCPKNWAEMAGDDRSRFCTHCQHAVHDLSSLGPEQARELLARSGGRLCVRMLVDAEGRIVFPQAAPVAVSARAGEGRRGRVALAGLAAGSALALASCQDAAAAMSGATQPPLAGQAPAAGRVPPPAPGEIVGRICPPGQAPPSEPLPAPPPPAPQPPPPRHRVGRVALPPQDKQAVAQPKQAPAPQPPLREIIGDVALPAPPPPAVEPEPLPPAAEPGADPTPRPVPDRAIMGQIAVPPRPRELPDNIRLRGDTEPQAVQELLACRGGELPPDHERWEIKGDAELLQLRRIRLEGEPLAEEEAVELWRRGESGWVRVEEESR